MRKVVYNILGSLFLVFGVVFLVNSLSGITGLVVIEDVPSSDSGFIGGVFILEGVALFILAQRKRKKGQAAMEFLMTYGWAILAAIIAIGILAYFGVFRASLSPAAAYIGAPFYIDSWTVQQYNVQMQVRNAGESSTLQNFTITPKGSDVYCMTGNNFPVSISQNSVVLKVNCVPLTVGSPFVGELSLIYRKPNSNILFETRGSIQENVKTDTIKNWIIAATAQTSSVSVGNPAIIDIHATNLIGEPLSGGSFLVFAFPPGVNVLSGSNTLTATTVPSGDVAFPFTPTSAGKWTVLFRSQDDTSVSNIVTITATGDS